MFSLDVSSVLKYTMSFFTTSGDNYNYQTIDVTCPTSALVHVSIFFESGFLFTKVSCNFITCNDFGVLSKACPLSPAMNRMDSALE